MQKSYYIVTRSGPQASIFALEFIGEGIFLTRVLTAGPAAGGQYEVLLRAVALREGIIGFLSTPGTSVITGLVGAFFRLGQAIECWRMPELALADPRWRTSTEFVYEDLRKRKDPRVV